MGDTKKSNSLLILVTVIMGVVILGGIVTYFVPFERNNEVSSEGVTDCGSMDPTEDLEDRLHIYRCFGNNLINCDKAKFEVVGDDPAIFEIKEEEGINCIVAYDGRECKVPKSFVEEYDSWPVEETRVSTIGIGVTVGILSEIDYPGANNKIECN